MGCCKCEDFKWPDPQDVVWVDPADEKEYCVFHAPAGEKWKELGGGAKYTAKEFNEHIFKRITEANSATILDGPVGKCVMRGIVTLGAIDFERYNKDNPLQPIDFSNAIFTRSTLFRNVCFRGFAVFTNARFVSAACFYEATFHEGASFSQATFVKKSRFSKVMFRRSSIFTKATFTGNSIFSRATFRCGASFHGSIFQSAVTFFHIEATGKPIRLHALSAATLVHLHVSRLELPAFSFLGCEWPDRLGPETHGDGSAKNLKACEELYRAMKQRAISEHDMPMASRWHGKEKEMALRRIQMEAPDWSVSAASQWLSSEAWPQLKHAAAHAREKVKQVVIDNLSPTALNALPRTLFATRMFRVSWWYNLSSGFGENPAQAARVLCALVVFVLGLMAFPGMQAAGKDAIPDPEIGERIYAALQHLLFITNPQYAPASSTLRSLLLVLTRLVIPIQAALFGFAMFNRFRR